MSVGLLSAGPDNSPTSHGVHRSAAAASDTSKTIAKLEGSRRLFRSRTFTTIVTRDGHLQKLDIYAKSEKKTS